MMINEFESFWRGIASFVFLFVGNAKVIAILYSVANKFVGNT